MKINKSTILSVLALCMGFASCATDEETAQNEKLNSSELSCTVREIESADDFSRSSLALQGGKMVFSWELGDEITVFAKGDNNAKQLYTLSKSETPLMAKFHADNFQLVVNQMYYALSVTESNNNHVRTPSQNNITVDYSGQTQTGNANTTHLGAYDFNAAGTQCKENNQAVFNFEHLGSTLRVVMAFDPTTTSGDEQTALSKTTADVESDLIRMTRFTEMEIFDSENSFRQQKRRFSFETGTNGDVYSFAWPEQTITETDRFMLTLQDGGGKDVDGITTMGVTRTSNFRDNSGGNTNNKLISYIELPPVDFTGKKVGVMLKGYYLKKNGTVWEKKNVSYVGTYEKNLRIVNGKAYQINLDMKKPDNFNVTLKVNHMWQHGDTIDHSRATGDPGYDKEIVTPTHIYYIYCHDGKVIKPTTAEDASTVTSITGLNSNNWETTSKDGIYISTYKGKGSDDTGILSLQKPAHSGDVPVGHQCTYHLYVVASTSDLTINVLENASEADVVQALTYNLPGSDVQVFMRDLYSTPWDETNFIGNLTDPMQDVILYHVAAKVDLKWNSGTEIKTVSANNVKDTGLYMFKPTENSYLETGAYTVSQAIEEDEQFFGRHVFYLPQFQNPNCSYNIGLNTTNSTIKFTPVTTGGFTSWLRWLKKQ